MQEFGIKRALLANYDVLKAYHNPDLPTIYVGDRHGWLATRYVKAKAQDLEDLSRFLDLMTGY